MKTKNPIICLLLVSSPFVLTGCFGALALAGAKTLAQGAAVKSATLGQQPGMIETAQKTGDAVRIMSANTSGQGEAIRYIDNPVDDRHPHAEDPLGGDRARLNTMKENLQYLQGLQRQPGHKDDPAAFTSTTARSRRRDSPMPRTKRGGMRCSTQGETTSCMGQGRTHRSSRRACRPSPPRRTRISAA